MTDANVVTVTQTVPVGARLTQGLSAFRSFLRQPAVVRSMPNTPGQIGEGITVWTASKEVSEEQQEMAQDAMNRWWWPASPRTPLHVRQAR